MCVWVCACVRAFVCVCISVLGGRLAVIDVQLMDANLQPLHQKGQLV